MGASLTTLAIITILVALVSDPCADYLVTGQTSLQPDSFEVDILLVEATSGRADWAETFELQLKPPEIIALRNEVANRVGRSLAQLYGAIQSDRARDADEHAPVLLGTYAAVLLFTESSERSLIASWASCFSRRREF